MENEITFNYLPKIILYFSLYSPKIIFFIAWIKLIFMRDNTDMDQNMLIALIATIALSIFIGPITRWLFTRRAVICFQENTFTLTCNGKENIIAYKDIIKLKYHTIRSMSESKIKDWDIAHYIYICSKNSEYYFASPLSDSIKSYKKNEKPGIYLLCLELSRRSECPVLCKSTNGEEFQAKDFRD